MRKSLLVAVISLGLSAYGWAQTAKAPSGQPAEAGITVVDQRFEDAQYQGYRGGVFYLGESMLDLRINWRNGSSTNVLGSLDLIRQRVVFLGQGQRVGYYNLDQVKSVELTKPDGGVEMIRILPAGKQQLPTFHKAYYEGEYQLYHQLAKVALIDAAGQRINLPQDYLLITPKGEKFELNGLDDPKLMTALANTAAAKVVAEQKLRLAMTNDVVYLLRTIDRS